MAEVFISLGSNLGDRVMNLETACMELEKRAGRISRRSSLYETAPWGFESEDHFLNMVICLDTDLDEKKLMEVLLGTELSMGRTREEKGYQSRIIDIDILFYDQLILETEHLRIPHPRMHLRKFVLIPLAEIAPGKIHPESGLSVAGLLEACTDKGEIRKWEPK